MKIRSDYSQGLSRGLSQMQDRQERRDAIENKGKVKREGKKREL